MCEVVKVASPTDTLGTIATDFRLLRPDCAMSPAIEPPLSANDASRSSTIIQGDPEIIAVSRLLMTRMGGSVTGSLRRPKLEAGNGTSGKVMRGFGKGEVISGSELKSSCPLKRL